jgi:hypothetical protein
MDDLKVNAEAYAELEMRLQGERGRREKAEQAVVTERERAEECQKDFDQLESDGIEIIHNLKCERDAANKRAERAEGELRSLGITVDADADWFGLADVPEIGEPDATWVTCHKDGPALGRVGRIRYKHGPGWVVGFDTEHLSDLRVHLDHGEMSLAWPEQYRATLLKLQRYIGYFRGAQERSMERGARAKAAETKLATANKLLERANARFHEIKESNNG